MFFSLRDRNGVSARLSCRRPVRGLRPGRGSVADLGYPHSRPGQHVSYRCPTRPSSGTGCAGACAAPGCGPRSWSVTLGEGVLLWRLPPVGTGLNLIEGVLLATFGNLVLVAAVAPWLAEPAGRPAAPATRTTTEREVLKDRVVDRPAAGRRVRRAWPRASPPGPPSWSRPRPASRTPRRCATSCSRSGSDELVRNIETANTVRLGEGYFRTCIARDDRDALLLRVRGHRPLAAEVVKDPSAEPNTVYTGALAPGRAAGKRSGAAANLEDPNVVAPLAQHPLGHDHGEGLARRPLEEEAAPDGLDPAVDRHRDVTLVRTAGRRSCRRRAPAAARRPGPRWPARSRSASRALVPAAAAVASSDSGRPSSSRLGPMPR